MNEVEQIVFGSTAEKTKCFLCKFGDGDVIPRHGMTERITRSKSMISEYFCDEPGDFQLETADFCRSCKQIEHEATRQEQSMEEKYDEESRKWNEVLCELSIVMNASKRLERINPSMIDVMKDVFSKLIDE